MSNQSDTRTVTSLRPGTKVALIVATGFLAVAAYFFLTPTSFMGKDGGLFGCGSPMSPNTNGLAKGQCGIIEDVARNQSFLFLALAIITAALGFLLFGSEPAAQTRGARTRLEDEAVEDDDVDDADSDRRPGLLAGRTERQSERTKEPRRRPRLGDEDEHDTERDERRRARFLDDDDDEDDAPRKVRRTRLVDDEDDDDVRPARRRTRFDDDEPDTVRD